MVLRQDRGDGANEQANWFRACALPLTVGVCMLATVGAGGCGAEDNEGELDPNEEASIRGDAIGEASCATAIADTTFAPRGTYNRVAPYSNPGCSNAVVVDIVNYQANLPMPPNAPVLTHVSWTGPVPSTQATCQSASLRVDLFKRVNGVFSPIASDLVPGEWLRSRCQFSVIDERGRMTTGNDYRIAVSATRTSTVQGDVSVFSASSGGGGEPPPMTTP